MEKKRTSIYTKTGLIIKRICGIKDLSIVRKRIKKRFGQLIYHRKYTAKELISLMQEMGMKSGSFICIHSSMKEFYNYTGTAEELIQGILDVLGPEGTLMMPAFPLPINELKKHKDYIFDASKDPTSAGYLQETFRKFPSVKRSLDVRHSVCAIGKLADSLTQGHQNCHDCWGEGSPWRQLCERGGLVFNLGLERSYMGTFHHCIESILQYEHPYWKQFFNTKHTYHYYDKNGKVNSYTMVESYIERRTRERKVTRYFGPEDWAIRKISNLEVKVYYLEYCFPKMLDLARKGICVYYVPNPKKFDFA